MTPSDSTYEKNNKKPYRRAPELAPGETTWNEIGNFCLTRGLFQQAELVYKMMLLAIRRQEREKGKTLHKGLAFYNLGLALYSQGKSDEAKDNIKNAYEEDKRTYGKNAHNYPAFKALNQLFGASPSNDSSGKQ